MVIQKDAAESLLTRTGARAAVELTAHLEAAADFAVRSMPALIRGPYDPSAVWCSRSHRARRPLNMPRRCTAQTSERGTHDEKRE